jgi:hypothetical protein
MCYLVELLGFNMLLWSLLGQLSGGSAVVLRLFRHLRFLRVEKSKEVM